MNGASLAVEYSYDANGNVLTDANKGITVSYNHLNLPSDISFTGGEQLEWLYTAGGQKLRKKALTASSNSTTKHYIGKVQYLDANLEFINHPEGRIIPTITGYTVDNEPIYSYEYEYTLQDHLGNARVFFSDKDGNGSIEVSKVGGYNEVLQQEHYYPFGMGIRGEWKFVQPQIGGVNQYLYNGKELNDDFGLNWNDYGARWYDAGIGRWGGVDPLAEKYSHLSSYNYVANNPLKFIDPNGKEIWIYFVEYKKNGKAKAKPSRVMYRDGKLYDRKGKETSVDNKYVIETVASLNYIRENGDDKVSFLKDKGYDKGLIDIMEDLPQEIGISQVKSLDGDRYIPAEESSDGKPKIAYNSRAGLEFINKEGNTVRQSPSTGLFHEFVHGFRDIFEGYSKYNESGLIDFSKMDTEENMITVGPEAEYVKKKGEGARQKHKLKTFKYYRTKGPNTVEPEKKIKK